MSTETMKTGLQQRIEAGGPVMLAQVSPPRSGTPEDIRAVAKVYAGKVHALGIRDNDSEVRTSALASAALICAEGVEPVVHVTTRDRNRIALLSDLLGAKALGVCNVLCTSGTHQKLGSYAAAKSVYDMDAVQLLQMYAGTADARSLLGDEAFDGAGHFFPGGVAAPFATPLELQVLRLAKKIDAGARFLVTQPAFDMDRFDAWWEEVAKRGIHRKTAIIAGVRVLTGAESARAYARQRPSPMVPDAILERIASGSTPEEQRNIGIQIAIETAKRLAVMDGVRGIDIDGGGNDAAALAVIEGSGVGAA